MDSRWQLVGGVAQGVEGLSKKEKGIMDMDNSVDGPEKHYAK